MKEEVYLVESNWWIVAFPPKRPPCDSIDGYVTSRPQRTAQHLKIFPPNKKKFSCLDCKCGDKTLNNGRILKTNICGWKWDIYWTRHCFNGCSYCGSRPRGRWRKRMRETQKLREKRGKKKLRLCLSRLKKNCTQRTTAFKKRAAAPKITEVFSWPILSLFLVLTF